MSQIIERHRVPLGPRLTILYHRTESRRSPLTVDCFFRLGYADLQPGQVYALMKAFQGQYAPAWRPRLLLTPDWSRFSFVSSPDYRRELDSQWQRLFELESALTSLDPLKEGLLQEQRWHQESREYLLDHAFQRLVFQGTAYDRLPLGQTEDLNALGQEALLDIYAEGLETSHIYIRIQDHQPLHEVLDRCRSLLTLAQVEPQVQGTMEIPATGFREKRLTQATEGAWFYLGLILPGMDQADWIFGPLFKAWMEDVWKENPAHPELNLFHSRWHSWQKASLLCFKLHSHAVNQLQEQKVALINWLAELRQEYVTNRRFNRALQQVLHDLQSESGTLYQEIDEMQSGWGHFQQGLQYLGLDTFKHALSKHLNADRMVLMEVCSEHVTGRQRPDPREHIFKLGYAPARKAQRNMAGKYTEIERLHLTPGWSMWLLPHADLPHLELGLWFSSGAAQDPVAGTTRLLLDVLKLRFAEELRLEAGKGAWRELDSWQSGVSMDASFFKWSVPWAELPHALKIMRRLLHDLDIGPELVTPLRRKHQTRLLAEHLNPLQSAKDQFTLSGFPNHPYGHSFDGTYLSLRQIHSSILKSRWKELRQTAIAHPLLLGNIPSFLDSELLLPAFAGIRESVETHLGGIPQVRTRRGDIFVRSSQLAGLRLEGQIFTEALPLEALIPLQLGTLWTQDRVRSKVGIPLECEIVTYQQAWYFSFSGLYTREERSKWLSDTMHITEPMNMLKQRLLADVRSRFEKSSTLWSDLVHWLSLGGTPGSFVDREHEVLALSQEQVEEVMHKYLSQESEWLQVIFQAQDSKLPAWGI